MALPIRALVAQCRIVFFDLLNQPPSLPPTTLQTFGRRYAAEIYLAAQELRDELTASPSDEMKAELATAVSKS